MKANNIGLYKNLNTGSMLSHNNGLTEEQINFLKSLKEGDRLVIWKNSFATVENKQPTHQLKVFIPKKTEESEADNG